MTVLARSARRRALTSIGVALSAALALAVAGCGSAGHSSGTVEGTPTSASVTIPASLLKEMRPIGAGRRFHPPVTGTPTGGCANARGNLEAHIELFGANKVVLIAADVGHVHGCYGNAVTIDPTGTVFFRRGATLADLFRAWGQPLSATRMASFSGTVRYYLDGKPVTHAPALSQHAEIVLEVGPYVPPHHTYAFPKGL